MRVIVRMWTKDDYHKDVVIMDEQQIYMSYQNTEAKGRHIMVPPIGAVRCVIDPEMFKEAVEFEVIVERTK